MYTYILNNTILFFTYLQKLFEVDEDRRDFVLTHAGKCHRTFRAKLAKKFLRDEEGNIILEPPSLYGEVIKDEHWKAFVKKHTEDEEFLVCNFQLYPCMF